MALLASVSIFLFLFLLPDVAANQVLCVSKGAKHSKFQSKILNFQDIKTYLEITLSVKIDEVTGNILDRKFYFKYTVISETPLPSQIVHV